MIKPSIIKIEPFMMIKINSSWGIRCLNSISSSPRLAKLITLKPSKITTKQNKTFAIASTTSHILNTLELADMSGVPLTKNCSPSMNGLAAVSIIVRRKPIMALISTSTSPPDDSAGLISLIGSTSD
ncbi:hypothetical protein D9M68_923120 [compost metagenome]